MKKMILYAVLLLFSPLLFAQDIDVSSKGATLNLGDARVMIRRAPFMQGDVEISALLNAGQQSEESSGLAGYTSSSISRNYMNFGISAGYYLADGFSIEPEVGIFVVESARPGFSGLMNASYTYRIGNSPVALFARAGFGAGTGTSIMGMNSLIVPVGGDETVSLYAFGGGVKFIVTPDVVLRGEVRFRHESYSRSYGFANMTVDYVQTNTVLFFGFSFLL